MQIRALPGLWLAATGHRGEVSEDPVLAGKGRQARNFADLAEGREASCHLRATCDGRVHRGPPSGPTSLSRVRRALGNDCRKLGVGDGVALAEQAARGVSQVLRRDGEISVLVAAVADHEGKHARRPDDGAVGRRCDADLTHRLVRLGDVLVDRQGAGAGSRAASCVQLVRQRRAAPRAELVLRDQHDYRLSAPCLSPSRASALRGHAQRPPERPCGTDPGHALPRSSCLLRQRRVQVRVRPHERLDPTDRYGFPPGHPPRFRHTMSPPGTCAGRLHCIRSRWSPSSTSTHLAPSTITLTAVPSSGPSCSSCVREGDTPEPPRNPGRFSTARLPSQPGVTSPAKGSLWTTRQSRWVHPGKTRSRRATRRDLRQDVTTIHPRTGAS